LVLVLAIVIVLVLAMVLVPVRNTVLRVIVRSRLGG
jgi:hypothetical protein